MGVPRPQATGVIGQDANDPLRDVLHECQPLFEVLSVALTTNEIENAATAIRDGQEPIDKQRRTARAAMHNAFDGIFDLMLKRSIRYYVTEHLSKHEQTIKCLAEELHGLRERLNWDDLATILQPYEAFRKRLKQDEDDKRAIAEYVSRRYFQDPRIRCFIHGSSLAIYLGKEIAISGTSGILIHTNSVPFPLTVLREGGAQQVYAFCGESYDSHCASWLFPRTATKTENSLRELFTRKENPLTTSFVMPLYVTMDGKMHFQRDETQFLAEILASETKRQGTETKRFVVLAAASRIRRSLPTNDPVGLSAMQIPEVEHDREVVEVIVSGRFNDGLSATELAESLRKAGRSVHTKGPEQDWKTWQPESRLRRLEASPGSDSDSKLGS